MKLKKFKQFKHFFRKFRVSNGQWSSHGKKKYLPFESREPSVDELELKPITKKRKVNSCVISEF